LYPLINKKKRIISLQVDLIKYQDALGQIVNLAKSKLPSYVCFANVHMTIEAYLDKNFSSQVNTATLVLTDGMPLVIALKLLYGDKQDRIAGMDALPSLMKLAETNQLKVFFFGSTSEQLSKIKKQAANDFPKLDVVGVFSPPFGRSLDDSNYIDSMNRSNANLVFVALGCPKQEKWMAMHFRKINAVLVGVGGAFSVYAGDSVRAPAWMRNYSLEWAYRLFQEPRRMWKRYLITNTLFIYFLIKQLIQKKFNG
jgi:N-acetylglucosaminyldiphosphoundecaprenol N-acetyl-beta-D-mannosaminyltransferase